MDIQVILMCLDLVIEGVHPVAAGGGGDGGRRGADAVVEEE